MNQNIPYIACWWSGGVASAVAVKQTIDLFGKDRCRILFIDVGREHEDTYRFKDDCEKWYGIPIETVTRLKVPFIKNDEEYSFWSVEDVWRHYKSLNVATGAICSTELKRKARELYQQENPDFIYNVFGFDLSEAKRAVGMTANNPHVKPIYPMMMFGTTKHDCFDILAENNIEPPIAYTLGFRNNNCLGHTDSDEGGCVQGGIGYWQKMAKIFPRKYQRMAMLEHEFTNERGYPVTMLKDQSKEALSKADKKEALVFLEPHPDYPNNKSLRDFPEMKVESFIDCNGYCGTYDLVPEAINIQHQINFPMFDD